MTVGETMIPELDGVSASRFTADEVSQIEQFLYREVRLLDERRYMEWYALLSDDLSYTMPTREVLFSQRRDEDWAVEKELVDPLSRLIASHRVHAGDVVEIERDGDVLRFYRRSRTSGLVVA